MRGLYPSHALGQDLVGGPNRIRARETVLVAIHKPEQGRICSGEVDKGHALCKQGFASIGLIVRDKQDISQDFEAAIRNGGHEFGLVGEVSVGGHG